MQSVRSYAAKMPDFCFGSSLEEKRLETGANFYGIYILQSSSHIVSMVLQIFGAEKGVFTTPLETIYRFFGKIDLVLENKIIFPKIISSCGAKNVIFAPSLPQIISFSIEGFFRNSSYYKLRMKIAPKASLR